MATTLDTTQLPAAAFEMKLLQETMQLLRDYKTDPKRVQEELASPRQAHGKRPYRLYLSILSSIYPEYPLSTSGRKVDPQNTIRFLNRFIADNENGIPRLQRWYGQLLNGEDPKHLSPEEAHKLEVADKEQDPQKGEQAIHEVLDEKDKKEEHSEKKAEQKPVINYSAKPKESVESPVIKKASPTSTPPLLSTSEQPVRESSAPFSLPQVARPNFPRIAIPVAAEQFLHRYTQPDKLLAPARYVLNALKAVTPFSSSIPIAEGEVSPSGETVSVGVSDESAPNVPSISTTPLDSGSSGINSQAIFRAGGQTINVAGSAAENIGGGVARSGLSVLDRLQHGASATGRAGQAVGVASQAARSRMWLLLLNPWVLGGLIFFFLIVVPLVLYPVLKSSAELPIYRNPFTGATITYPGSTSDSPIATDISSCKFIRGQEGSEGVAFKSSRLLGYFQNAAAKSGMPAALVAAFARVESPSSVNLTDESLSSYKCAVSETGALGLMQIQPAGTKGHAREAVNLGASYIGKTVDTLTREDYCDIEKSILIGIGFIIKKMEYNGYSNGGKWNPEWTNNKQAIQALVEGYYGCFRYPVCEDKNNQGGGPYSYADDVWNSLQACKVSAPTNVDTPPPPSDVNDLRNQIAQKFGVLFDASFTTSNTQVLQWAWTAYNRANSIAPKYFPLIHQTDPTVYVHLRNGTSERQGAHIYIGPQSIASGETFMRHLLIHEMGHSIHGPRGSSPYDSQMSAAITQDNAYISAYAAGAVPVGSPICRPQPLSTSSRTATQLDENFADSVSYYINSDIAEQNYSQNCPVASSSNPIWNGTHPAQLQLMKTILSN